MASPNIFVVGMVDVVGIIEPCGVGCDWREAKHKNAAD